MKTRLLVLALLLPVPALAQIQVFVFDGTSETPAGSFFNVGSATPGDTLETRFRVRNQGSGPAALQTLSLAGKGFQLVSAYVPSLPYTIAPGNYAEFRVDFAPSSIATFSAFMTVNTTNITLQGKGVAAASVTLAGSQGLLAAGAAIDFGPVTLGNSKVQNFTLSNPSPASLTVQAVTVTGAGFSGPIGLTTPLPLASGQTASFQVQFKPQNPQSAQGTLIIDGRSFTLTGLGLSPPLASLPALAIHLAST
ncbi:MAG TPA: choice-of-anchor D domain-containing protein, partial [Candidatus Sulfopaludibacter sp.]|nr:choice-of-anchor D domain-containing protein [Candidatus Sulfopaludibacter sp.]